MLEQAVKIRSLRSHWFVVQLRIPHPAPLAKNPFPKSDRLLVTTDSHFRIFRRNRRQIIPLLAPLGL